ncbi:MAG: hypothetical protein Q7R52_01020 [archaeon]|nr:hypothetical protein [archaeon]
MGLFRFGEEKVVDLNEGYRRQQKVQKRKKQESSSPTVEDAFLGSIAESSKKSYKFNPETGERYEDKPEESGDNEGDKRKKLAKRLMDMTDRIEEISNKLYQITQRLDVVEKKLRISNN